jgi:nicotinic acid mononucleotide adenylyltransferase
MMYRAADAALGVMGGTLPPQVPVDVDHICDAIDEASQRSRSFGHSRWTAAVLVATGAYAPPHREHVRSVVVAATHIADNVPYAKFVGAVMIPVCDHGTSWDDAVDRCAMAHAAAADEAITADASNTGQIACGKVRVRGSALTARATRAGAPPTEVRDSALHARAVRAVRDCVARHYTMERRASPDRVRVWYVCGLDYAVEHGLLGAAALDGWADGLIVMGRSKADTADALQLADNVAFIPSTADADTSSTMVRELMARDDGYAALTASGLVGDNALRYIRKNRVAFARPGATAK